MHKKTRYSIEQSPLYGLRSRSRLAKLLKTNNRELRTLSRGTNNLYSEFGIPKADGGTRDIENPVRRLKLVQATLARFLTRIEPGEYLFCPVKGRSYVGNAASHLQNRHVHCLDIYKFFPSVSSRRVYWFFAEVLQCAPDIAGLLVAISTFKQHLPTGSPLSPILAHFSYIDMWTKIAIFSEQKGYKLTVYVDDLAISSEATVRNVDIWEIKKIIAAHGLKYHKERDYREKPATITGCVISDGKLKIPFSQYKKRRMLEKAAHTSKDIAEKEIIHRRLLGINVQMRQIMNHHRDYEKRRGV